MPLLSIFYCKIKAISWAAYLPKGKVSPLLLQLLCCCLLKRDPAVPVTFLGGGFFQTIYSEHAAEQPVVLIGFDQNGIFHKHDIISLPLSAG